MKNKAILNNQTMGAQPQHSDRLNRSHFLSYSLLGSVIALSSFNVSCSRNDQAQEDKKKLELVGYDLSQDGFFKAASQDNIQALKIFKANKFDLSSKDLLGRSAVHVAADSGAVRALNFLHENGAKLDALDNKKHTPLMLAAANGRLEAIEFLLKSGATTQLRDDHKKFALLYAIDSKSDEAEQAIRLIAPHNRDLLDTALLYAADQNKPLAIQPLVQHGASVYARSEGMTGLMIASMRGNDEVAKELLNHGANAYAVSDDGKLARDYANGNEKMLTILSQANAPTAEDGDLALEWNEKELEDVVRKAMERYHESEDSEAQPEALASQPKAPNHSTGSNHSIPPAPPTAPVEVKVTSISGKQLPIKAASRADLANEMSMATYAEKPLPLIMTAADTGTVEVQDLRQPQAEPVPVKEGSTIAMTGLKVTKIRKKMVTGKVTGGVPKELVTLVVQDEKSGKTREIYSGFESSAADAVAVVRLKSTGEHLIVRRGDIFTNANGTEYKVSDVNEREIVIDNIATGEVTLLPLKGNKH